MDAVEYRAEAPILQGIEQSTGYQSVCNGASHDQDKYVFQQQIQRFGPSSLLIPKLGE
ncbi:hypothetical protein D3C84_701220 [compost metagenome]